MGVMRHRATHDATQLTCGNRKKEKHRQGPGSKTPSKTGNEISGRWMGRQPGATIRTWNVKQKIVRGNANGESRQGRTLVARKKVQPHGVTRE